MKLQDLATRMLAALLITAAFGLPPAAGQSPGSGLGGMFDPDLLDPPDKPFSWLHPGR